MIPSASERRAFTLVELLLVLAIVAMIVALLLPAAFSLRQRARSTACLSNLRSLQQASLAYSTDSSGWLIDARLPHGGNDQGSDQSFVEVLARLRYCDTSLIRSPLDDSPHWSTQRGGDGVPVPGSTARFRQTSYGLNNHLAREYSPWGGISASLASDRARAPRPQRSLRHRSRSPRRRAMQRAPHRFRTGASSMDMSSRFRSRACTSIRNATDLTPMSATSSHKFHPRNSASSPA